MKNIISFLVCTYFFQLINNHCLFVMLYTFIEERYTIINKHQIVYIELFFLWFLLMNHILVLKINFGFRIEF